MTIHHQMIFEGLTAWFSDSVSQATRQYWLEGGGRQTGIDNAQYIFSQTASSPDTQRIYESAAYLDEHLTVFHASFISACIKQGSLENVELGNYILPPAEVQEVVHREIGTYFVWEEKDSQLPNDHSNYAKLPNSQSQTKSRESGTANNLEQAATSGIQSAGNKSHSKNSHKDTDNQSKSAQHKTSPEGKTQDQSRESRQGTCMSGEGKTNLRRNLRSDREKQTKHSNLDGVTNSPSEVEGTITLGKHKTSGQEPVCGKKQKLSGDDVAAAEKEEIWRLENLAKVVDKIEDFMVGQHGFNIWSK